MFIMTFLPVKLPGYPLSRLPVTGSPVGNPGTNVAVAPRLFPVGAQGPQNSHLSSFGAVLGKEIDHHIKLWSSASR